MSAGATAENIDALGIRGSGVEHDDDDDGQYSAGHTRALQHNFTLLEVDLGIVEEVIMRHDIMLPGVHARTQHARKRWTQRALVCRRCAFALGSTPNSAATRSSTSTT